MPASNRPGIFWTWQDRQVEERSALESAVADIARHGFGKLLVQPRGCRYAVDDEAFVAAVTAACEFAHAQDLELWLHLDPRSMARTLTDAAGESAEYLIVAGTGDEHSSSPLATRPLDAETEVRTDGAFNIRIDYPRTRPYHVHSDGAITFRPLRLERCLAYRRDSNGLVEVDTVRDVSGAAHLFTNELSGYVEVFGNLRSAAEDSHGTRPPRALFAGSPPPPGERWFVLALVAFASNYPDLAGSATRARTGQVLKRYVEAGARLGGVWWDEPGYCTGFDRNFRGDRGRLPWGPNIAAGYRQRTGRDALDDTLYLLAETDDGLWGSRREDYYRTVEDAVFGAQAHLLESARALVGPHVRMGVHQTWHQNADDVINGCMDWWRGARILGAGFADVGDAERVDEATQMSEVTAMATIAVSLGRRSERHEAYYNLWGVNYGSGPREPGAEIVDWWVDLQATLGCNWLAHTYGPTGYFERPPVWGPGYPDHPTWARMSSATARLARALDLAEGSLPFADVALIYPLGALYRLGSDIANPLARGTHDLIAGLVRRGLEIDVVSPEALRDEPADRYRAVVYLHPFGATATDLNDLAQRQERGTKVLAQGLPPSSGEGYAEATDWERLLGLRLPSVDSTSLADPEYATVEDLAGQLEPTWQLPQNALGTRTLLSGGGTFVRLCPAHFNRPFQGILRAGEVEIEMGECLGLLGIRLGADGEVQDCIAPEGLVWNMRSKARG